ncbi:sugar phosphate isomerase/epimerase [Candidatus Sumerlaeota bacterium]|nr:sugar phosphate isomerase/epimerase [Candidatus Sumerlaeota bacterium]
MTLSRQNLPLGIIHFMLFPETMRGQGPVVETLKSLVEDPDFRFLEVTHIEDSGARAEAAAMLRESGKGYAYGAQPCLLSRKQDLNHPDAATRMEAVDTVKRAVDEAAEIGAGVLAFLSGKDPGPADRPAARGRLRESVLSICAHTRSADPEMRVILETFDRVPFGKNALIGPTREAVEFAELVREEFPDFSIMLDLSHLPLLSESPLPALEAARDVLGHAHVGNCVMRWADHPAYGDEHPMFGIAEGENGAGELAEYLDALARIGYLNAVAPRPVSFEVKPMPGQKAAEVLANAKQTLDEAWRILGWPE